ncbi:hypothetical protein LPB140_00785 [Sphingorhabdus lutea]|uniref:Uncharacterized protein n=2 Tax=Sphingorhabdus lutea TaxID=1913578 RepID=A0A1L3J900_9SPHN|nr:hypothetical protein LPB140_00785 [Sphingorhabdus lutea]
MHILGINPMREAAHFLGIAAGALIGLFFLRIKLTNKVRKMVQMAVILLLVLSLPSPGVDGVHRWIDTGMLHWNVAALMLPILLALWVLPLKYQLLQIWTALAIMAILVVQPDASQASAFGAAILALRFTHWRGQSKFIILAIILFIIAAWMRHDPLKPVLEVEEILFRTWDILPILAVMGWISLAVTAMCPLYFIAQENRKNAAPLAIYFAIIALMPIFGAYPFPLIGYGFSFPIGFCVAMAILINQDNASKDALTE